MQLDNINLKDESNNNYLNEGQRMRNLSCSLCEKKFVKSYKGVTDKNLIAVFNIKQTALHNLELLTSTLVVCRFCIYCNYKDKLNSDNDDNCKSV